MFTPVYVSAFTPWGVFTGAVSSGATPTPTPATADASYALDAAGGTNSTQVYDSIATAWKGAGADTADFSSGYLIADSTSDRCYTVGSDIQYSDVLTIEFEYQVNYLYDGNMYPFYYNSGGDYIFYRNYQSSGAGSFKFRANSGTETGVNFSNAGFVVDTWIHVYIVVDITGQDLYVYIDGSLEGSSIDDANVADMGTLAGNLYLGYIASGTNQMSVRNFKVYNAVVTP